MKPFILVATDFSDASEAAENAAVPLARRLDASIELIHVLERVPVGAVSGPDFGVFAHSLADRAAALDDAMRDALVERLHAKASELSSQGVQVHARVLAAGRPWDALLEVAEKENPRLIAMGTQKRRGPARWLLGSVAERTVRGATCPVLVVPAGAAPAFGEWADRSRNLRIAVALHLGEGAPMSFVRQLRQAGPCDVTVTHLYWPPAEMKRLHLGVPFDLESPPKEIQALVDKDLRALVGELPGSGSLSIVVRPEWGRISDPLLLLAKELSADLLVVGTHGGRALESTSDSTTTGVLRRIDLPVAFVPVPS